MNDVANIASERTIAVTPARPTAHDITERATLIRARGYADIVRQHPEHVQAAKAYIADLLAADAQTAGHLLWRRLLDEDLETMLERMTSDDPQGRLLRSNNPFSVIIGFTDEEERRRTWQQAKNELSTSST